MAPPTRVHRPKSPLQLFLLLAPLFVALPWLALHLHYQLPEPVVEPINIVTSLPQLAESRMLEYARYLSEDIGYRTVGTREHAIADAWMRDKLVEMKEMCDEAARRRPDRALECEIWRQRGNGKHRFDMMGHRVYKSYHGLTNHILRISSGLPGSKEHAVLVNSHLDSTLPSPGAADDAICVGVMLELIRVLVNTDSWEPAYSIVFLFNHAEESLQDASHLFSTQHELGETIRAVINLEAAGTKGPELLFQATSEEMIKAYSYVPRPHGSVLANDVFNSGIILSDTDFRQFVHYRNLTGLDMAIVGNSYLYHTRKDLVENIEPGVAQHMAENVMAILLYLTANPSPLPHLITYNKPATVYYGLLGRFFIAYSYRLAFIMSVSLSAASLALAVVTTADWSVVGRAWLGVFGGVLGALGGANLAAFIMTSVIGKGMSWFSREWLCIVLYAPPAVLGAMIVQLLVHPAPAQAPIEHQSLTSLMVFYSFLATGVQSAGLGSAYMPFINSLSLFIATALNEIFLALEGGVRGGISNWTYVVGQIIPLVAGCEAFTGFLDIFVPLTGRLGKDAPVENIIATIVGLLTFYLVPLALPLAHRFGRPALRVMIGVLFAITVATMTVFASPGWGPFDVMHQKRLFVTHVENITSGEFSLHMASLDSAPAFREIVAETARQFSTAVNDPEPVLTVDGSPAWDVIYPVSDFLASYGLTLLPPHNYVSTWSSKFGVWAANDVYNQSEGTRRVRLVIDHPGIIWSVIAFDADVIWWDLDEHPPEGFTRHHVKEASFFGIDSWSLDLLIRVPQAASSQPGLLVNFIGISEKAMWPAKKHEREGPAMEFFEALDTRLHDMSGGTIDATLIGCVAGAVTV